jgi:hypothetical protein
MRIFLDTNILLNDFFHRNPDFGFQRISDPEQTKAVEDYRQKVHESLGRIAAEPGIEVWTSSTVFARFAALLGDLLVPAADVLEELQYWQSNLKMVEISIRHLEESLLDMGNAETKMDFDDFLIRKIALENQMEVVLTSLPKSREFFWPVLVFKPENLDQLFRSSGPEKPADHPASN